MKNITKDADSSGMSIKRLVYSLRYNSLIFKHLNTRRRSSFLTSLWLAVDMFHTGTFKVGELDRVVLRA